MTRRLLRYSLLLGLLAGLGFGVAKMLRSRRSGADQGDHDGWKSSPLSNPPIGIASREPEPTAPGPPDEGLVEPTMLQAIVDRKSGGAEPEGTPAAGRGTASSNGQPPAAPDEPAAPAEADLDTGLADVTPPPPAPRPTSAERPPATRPAAAAQPAAATDEAASKPAPPAGKTAKPAPPARAAKPAKKAAKATKKAAKATKRAAKKAARPPRAARAWVEPTGDVCPSRHPVKAKNSSRIYHLPGMQNYDRTSPDRCYRDGEAAEVDGYRKSKR